MRIEKQLVKVKDVMKLGVDIVDGMMTVSEALDSIKYPGNRTLIINKRHDDDEFGVVMFSDIARQIMATDHSPDRVNIYEIMSKPVISVHPEMNIRYCISLFDRFGLSRAPVIEDGKILGMISYSDIVLKGMPARKKPAEN
jgi:signal-transduction protein with cAMP-binding, CBS, and nucleotidyltransferase domain